MTQHIEELLEEWLAENLTQQQAELLLQAFKDPQHQVTVERWLLEKYNNTEKGNYFSREQKKTIFNKAVGPATDSTPNPASPEPLMAFPQSPGRRIDRRKKKKSIIRAALTLCMVSCLIFIFWKLNHPAAPVQPSTKTATADIAAPATATPTISWGAKTQALTVDQALRAHSSAMRKDKNGCLIFSPSGKAAPSGTVTVPHGSRPVHIQLPDGSQVWLNTGSSLQFPGEFHGSKRTVYLTGEAYFEVVHNTKQSFEVRQGNNTVLVLGTHFNINAYKDNPVAKVTLLKGLVQINHSSYLHPAEQAIVKDGHIQVLSEIDLQQVMAWKNNQFYFNGTPAREILKQLARWYNIEIIYKAEVPKGHYSGIISKDNSLSQVLTILETGGLKFKLHQHTLWIY